MARLLIGSLLVCGVQSAHATQTCGKHGVAIQVLGSGGPELQDKRASSSYLVWQDGRARVLIDAGGGSALRLGQSTAQLSQLDAVLFTHLHADHSSDFPALIKSLWFEGRERPLPVFGPAGNELMPSTSEFVSALFGKRGAYRYLNDALVPPRQRDYRLQVHDVAADAAVTTVLRSGDLAVSAARVVHGPIPALAWRIEIDGATVAFSGDTSGEGKHLPELLADVDLFVAHNAIPEGATGVERRLHMPPSVIGQLAHNARAQSLALSHRMLRTLGKEDATLSEIRKRYAGPTTFSDDLDCFPLPDRTR
ncbi:MBL fold metallo-hydrolase [Lysobacter firmicutimachus]|uniref:MBL fold metallo-hydrolase n=1 Tax=Lysobacter firmicutimachus TaxID=1792846 RepID=A0AAU8MX16_9GAMM